jgi:hypothetical protein
MTLVGKLSEYKAQIGIAVTIALVGALALGVLTNYSFPSTTTTSSVTVPASSQIPLPLAGELSAKDVSCSISTGTCALTIANNSSASLQLEGCRVQVIANVTVTISTNAASSESTTTTYIALGNGSTSTVITTPSTSAVFSSTITQTLTEYEVVNGTIGGLAAAGIPANSEVAATCSVATAELAHETKGSLADGNFMLRLLGSAESYPAGAETGLGFGGTWS